MEGDPAGRDRVVVGLAEKGVDVALPAIEFLSDKGIRGSYYGSGDPARTSPSWRTSRSPASSTSRAS